MRSETLYVTDLSPFGARLRLVSAFTGQSFTEAPPPGGAGSEAMKAISHFGKMPAIDTGGGVLIESLPLMEYLIDKAGGSPLRPDDIVARAAVRGVMVAHDVNVLTAIWPMFLQLRTGKPDPGITVAALKAGSTQYAILSKLFDADGDFAIGGAMTLADLAMAPFALLFGRVYPMFDETSPFAEQPRLKRWWDAVGVVPEVARAMGVMDAAFTRAFARK